MDRCLQLAALGRSRTAPNPMVGSVLVWQDRVIGEGWHRAYGGPHAEVNCLSSVKDEDRSLIPESTLYVSLEPCAHHGKTPPCADLIIENRIPRVVIGCRDPFVAVNGKGIEKLLKAGIEVTLGIREAECRYLNRRFLTFHTAHRPYVILKWAQSFDRKIANEDYSRVFISNARSNRLVHKWRGEEMAILVGTNTALFDDPRLNTRLWPGGQSVRLVLDRQLRLPSSLKLFSGETPTLVFNLRKHTLPFEKMEASSLKGTNYYQVGEDASMVHQIINALYRLGLQSVLVEGGSYLLQSFIDEGLWDEARIITNEDLEIASGLPAPVLTGGTLQGKDRLGSDLIRYYHHPSQPLP